MVLYHQLGTNDIDTLRLFQHNLQTLAALMKLTIRLDHCNLAQPAASDLVDEPQYELALVDVGWRRGIVAILRDLVFENLFFGKSITLRGINFPIPMKCLPQIKFLE